MDRISAISDRVATTFNPAYEAMSNPKHLYTDFGGSKLARKNVTQRGDKVTVQAVMDFEKLVYAPHWVGNALVQTHGEQTTIDAFREILGDLKTVIQRQIAKKYEEDPPLNRVFGWNEADDYKDPEVKIQSFQYGKIKLDHGEVFIDGSIKFTLTATKLPDMSEGPYDRMSDRELKGWIQEWGNQAPENFWMDGEYRGTAAARVRGLMRDWRAMTPNQQVKHLADLKKWV